MQRRFLSSSKAGRLTLMRAAERATRFEMPAVESPERSRALRCCLIGPTNAGKSTLLNSLLDERVTIVSDKIHTTRENTLGYLTDEDTATQVEFVDAPGSLGPDVPALHRAVWDAVRQTELALIVVDSKDTRSHGQVSRFLTRLQRELTELEQQSGQQQQQQAPSTQGQQQQQLPPWLAARTVLGETPLARPQTVLVLNKVDAVKPKTLLLDVSKRLHRKFTFDWPPFMVSAKTGDGVHDLRSWLLNFARPGKWVAPVGVTHVQPPLTRATEIIREQIFSYLSRELPYTIEQRNVGWTELSNPEGALRIDQQLLLPKGQASTRKIVEKRLPGLASAARREMRREFGRTVFLHLSVGYFGPNEHDLSDLTEELLTSRTT